MIILFLASKADADFVKPMEDIFKEFGVGTKTVMASAHKVPDKVVEMVREINAMTEPTVVITVVGMSNGLGGVVAGTCIHPVINCPPHKDLTEYHTDIHSSLRMPSDVPALTVIHPKNAALAAVRILAESDAGLRKKIEERMAKIRAGY
ncbi:AIR carboxylase family protein [Candidatus Peribacteria bacterium]|nr:AIR carboxylase family protein [Candidatus Peribacteria bacterium]